MTDAVWDRGDRPWSLTAHLVLPFVLLGGAVVAKAAGGTVEWLVLNPQTGIMETATGGMALAAGVVALWAWLGRAGHGDWLIRAWLFLFAAAMLFFGGEDLNWGQYYLGWDAPAYFQAHNGEQETNLHNMTWWANQLPRMLVEVWLLVACILVPLGWHWPRTLTSAVVPDVLWPDTRLVLVAALSLVLKLPKLLQDAGFIASETIGGIRTSEVQEMMIAYTLLLYAVRLARVCDDGASQRSRG